MDQEKFLQELEEIKTGYNVGSREFPSRSDGGSICNRLYNALLECLAQEADHVEAKLKVLTSTLCFYVDLRIRQDAISPEADAFGHFLFMECSRLVLGLQFHHLENTDPYKASFKSAISDVYTRLQEFAIGQVFVVLEWLMVNQWSHPTLVAMMKGEEIEKERALNFIRSGEYPELFRLRVEMLMQSGCDNFASNLVSWCIQSPLFESDVPLRSTHLLLLQKLGKYAQLQNQCYQMNCCLAREVIKYMEDRLLEDVSFLLSLSYNFLFIDWVKPANFCCTKSLLESWLKIQRQKEPDIEKFMDSVSKIVGLAQNVRQLNILLDAMINLFDSQFIQFCSELAINSIQKYRQLQQMHDGFAGESSSADAASGLVQICRVVAKLYQNHPQINLSCLTSALCLEPTEESYKSLETAFRISPTSLCSYDVASTFPAILDVSPNTLNLLLENIDSLRPPNLHPQLGWDVLVKSLLPNFEANLDDGNLLSGVIDGTEADGVSISRFNFCDDGLGPKEVEMEGVSCMLDQESLGYPPDGIVSPSLTHQVLNDDTLTGDHDIDESVGDGVLFQRHCHQEMLSGEDAYRYNDGSLLPQDGVGKHVLNNITLDDIQQVLSGSTLGSSGKEAPMDERALQEITAFLQSEMGKNSSALGFESNLTHSQMNDFLQSPDSLYLNNPKSSSPPPYYSAIARSHHYGQSNDRSQNCSSSVTDGFQERVSSPSNLPTYEETPNPPSSESKNHAGANILVTDSNFPYLKQFLPHLQTVMQSVQSLVRCSSNSNNVDASSVGMAVGSRSHHVVQSSSTCSSISSSATFPSSIASNDTQDDPSLPSNSPHFKEVRPDCSSPNEAGVTLGSLKQPQSMQTSSTRSSVDGSPKTGPSLFEDVSLKPLLKCDFCNKEFMSKAGRTTHMLRVHSRNKKLLPGGISRRDAIPGTEHASGNASDSDCNGQSESSCPAFMENEAASSVQAVDRPADSSAGNLKHCFVKIVRLDKDSSQHEQQARAESDASQVVLPSKRDGSGREQIISENQRLLRQVADNNGPPCMCESCGEMFSAREQSTGHNCDRGALINAPILTPASVHSTTNPLQNLDILDNRSNQMYKESEPGASKLLASSISSGSGNQKIVFLVNSNLQSNTLSGVLQSNQSKMQAFLRTLKISNTNNQNFLIPGMTAHRSTASSGTSLASPRSIPVTTPQSSQSQKILQQRLQLQVQESTSKAINDKQPPFIEMLKLADHFLKSNNFKVAQQPGCQALANNLTTSSSKSQLPETLHVLSIQNNNNTFQQMNLLANNQKLLHVINKTNLTIPQLKVALQGNIILNNTNNANVQLQNAGHQSALHAQSLKLELPGKEVLVEGIRMVEQVEFLCESCLLTFPELDAASKHVSSSDHRASNVARHSVYCCPFCGVKYRDKMTVKNHIIFTCPNSIKPLSELFAFNKFHNNINGIVGTANNNPLSDTTMQCIEGHSAAGEVEVKNSEMKGSSDIKQEPENNVSTTCAKSLSLYELVNSPITMVSLLKQPSQVQSLQQLHKCHFCLKMFSSADYLGLHVSTRHQTARQMESEADPEQKQGNTSAMIKNLILKSNMVAASNNEAKNIMPTPSAVSVPTLEQLTLGFKHASSEGLAQTPNSPFASTTPRSDVFSLEGKTLQSPAEISDANSTPATPKQSLINIPMVNNQKNFASISNIQNMSQLPSLVPHPPKTSKAKGILYKNVYMQCEGTYYCSICKADLSSRESKRNHRQLACGDPKTVTYSRKYFYLCPYCSEKFPSQKECRQHQVTECLPMIGVSTDELTVKELACPLCPKKYHNLIPLKGHMTQVHHLPKSETRKMLEGLGYLETAFDQHILTNASQVSSSSFGIFSKAARNAKSCAEEVTTRAQTSQPSSQPAALSSNNVNLASSCSSMDIFDLDPDMSSDVNSDMPCDVIYSKESSVMFSPEDSEDRLKKDSCFDEYDVNSTLLNIDNGATPNSFGNESENNRKLQTPTLLSQASFDESPSSWSSPSPNVSSSLQLPSSVSSRFDDPVSCSSFTADSTLSPEQKRRRNSNSTKPAEFFTMMFRNYPILAKGVYICSACQSQMASSSEADRHVTDCTAQKNGKPTEIKRSTLFKCTHCTATFWKAKLCRQHQIESCLSEASTSGGLVDLESLTMPSVACPLCSVRSYNRSGLMSHMKYKHGMDTKGVREIMEKCGIRKQTPERFGASATTSGSISCPFTSESSTTISTIPDVFSMSVAASSIVSSDNSHPVVTNSVIAGSLESSTRADDEEVSRAVDSEPIPTPTNLRADEAPPSTVKSNSAAPNPPTKQNNESKRKFGSIIGSVTRNSKKEKLTISLKSNKRPADDVRSSHATFNSSPGGSDSSSDDLQKPPMAKKKPVLPEELSSAAVARSLVC